MSMPELRDIPRWGTPGYSNCDHEWDDGFDAADLILRGETAPHYAWDHCGAIWWEDGNFREQVWRYGIPIVVITRGSLAELVDAVNDEFGHD